MGMIYGFITATRVKWEATVPEWALMVGKTEDEVRAEWEDDSDYDSETDTIRLEEPLEESGWIDRGWSDAVLHDSRNDVTPVVSVGIGDHLSLHEDVKDALEWLEGGYRDNGDGTFHAEQRATSFISPWEYDYSIHFVHKFYGANGWVEESWLGAEEVLKREGHSPYPHTPGTIYGCERCENECFCTEDEEPCVYCATEIQAI